MDASEKCIVNKSEVDVAIVLDNFAGNQKPRAHVEKFSLCSFCLKIGEKKNYFFYSYFTLLYRIIKSNNPKIRLYHKINISQNKNKNGRTKKKKIFLYTTIQNTKSQHKFQFTKLFYEEQWEVIWDFGISYRICWYVNVGFLVGSESKLHSVALN